MANGKFTLGKQSGDKLGLVFHDGVSDTEVVLPESGELVTKDSPAFTGIPTAYSIINKIFFFQVNHCKESFEEDIKFAEDVLKLKGKQ